MHLRHLSRVGLIPSLSIPLPALLAAQNAAKPTIKSTATVDSPSRWDSFAGYSYLAPKATIDSENSNLQFVPTSDKASTGFDLQWRAYVGGPMHQRYM